MEMSGGALEEEPSERWDSSCNTNLLPFCLLCDQVFSHFLNLLCFLELLFGSLGQISRTSLKDHQIV